MKQYTKLPIPKDSAWNRFRWGRYIHWRIRYFFQGVWNIIRWMPTIYHDRDWDHTYITQMLQKKIEFQRAYLVNANRHLNIDRDNYWMTVVLNLLEREHASYYEMEKYDYVVMGDEIFDSYKSDNLEDFIAKYPSAVRAIKKKFPNYPHYDNDDSMFKDKDALSHYICYHRQEKAHKLIFRILEEHSAEWWD
jgi:hypothetical protein